MVAYVGHIEKQTVENTYFRRVLFTGKHAQLVVMCLGPGEGIGDEVHQNVDQFFRNEQGATKLSSRGQRTRRSETWPVPSGTSDNVIRSNRRRKSERSRLPRQGAGAG